MQKNVACVSAAKCVAGDNAIKMKHVINNRRNSPVASGLKQASARRMAWRKACSEKTHRKISRHRIGMLIDAGSEYQSIRQQHAWHSVIVAA